jgi:archaellum component FlaC
VEKISKLDLNVDTITKQLDNISRNLDIVKDTLNENKSFFQNLIDSLLSWLRSIFG